jgi:hypothetical protein
MRTTTITIITTTTAAIAIQATATAQLGTPTMPPHLTHCRSVIARPGQDIM